MNRLKQLRTNANLTLREVEDIVGIRNATLSAIENNKQPFREIHVLKLTSFFDVSSDYLLGYSNNGIGIYFASSQDDEDHVYVTYADYEQIKQRYEIKEMLLNNAVATNWVIKSLEEEKRIIRNKKSIYRSVDIPKESVELQENVKHSIINELDQLDTQDLEKVLKFIKDYIK